MSEFNLYDGNNSNNSSNSYYDKSAANYYGSSNTSAGTSSVFGSSFRKVSSNTGAVLTDQQYYGTMCACLLWGFGVNYILCKFFASAFMAVDYRVLLVGYLICALAGSFIYRASQKPAISFLGYNMVVLPVGILLSVLLQFYNPRIVEMAFLTTAIITACMTVMGFLYPQVFSRIASALTATLLIVIVVELFMTLVFRSSIGIMDYIVALLFSLYIAVDLGRASSRAHTLDNAIDAAAELYMDIINVFIRILSIMARNKD